MCTYVGKYYDYTHIYMSYINICVFMCTYVGNYYIYVARYLGMSKADYTDLSNCSVFNVGFLLPHVRQQREATMMMASFFNAGNNGNGKAAGGVLVVGATGRTGRRMVEVLKKKGQKVTAGVRSIEKGEEVLGKSNGKFSFLELDVEKDSPQLLAEKIAGFSAVICATGFAPTKLTPALLLGPTKVDYQGTVRLTDAVVKANVPKFVLVTSLLTNGAAAGQIFNKNYVILNLFGGVLVLKNLAERYIMKQKDLDYTIVRPGGLKESPPEGNIRYGKEDTLFGGSISRYSVAEVCVAALTSKAASRKVVEIIAEPDAPKMTFEQGFASL